MTAATILREAFRNVVCASFAYALVLQLVAGALVSAAHASLPPKEPGGLGAICTTNGMVPSASDPAESDHHRTGEACCAMACAAPSAFLTPPQVASAPRAPGSGVGMASSRAAEAAIRGPPIRSKPHAPRAPPGLSRL